MNEIFLLLLVVSLGVMLVLSTSTFTRGATLAVLVVVVVLGLREVLAAVLARLITTILDYTPTRQVLHIVISQDTRLALV